MTGTAKDPDQPGESGIELVLRQSPIVDLDRVGVGSNQVFLATLESRLGAVRAIYKPAGGERPLWDFPEGTLHRREVAAFEVDRALGWGFLPVTVLRQEAPLGSGSLQEFVEGPSRALDLDQELLDRQLRGVAVLDVLINNADRKAAHLLIDRAGHLKGIDHGVTFNTEFKLRTVLADLGGERVPEMWLRPVGGLLSDQGRMRRLQARLRRLLAPEEVQAFLRRGRHLLADGSFPSLHPWYGRPFER
ncbi:MAG: protein kinase family protein [Candidatus Dormibacteria bacterium]